jgi:hypothetical protein
VVKELYEEYMTKCESDGCERIATHMIKFDKQWHAACLFHAAFMESLGCEIEALEDHEKEKGSV